MVTRNQARALRDALRGLVLVHGSLKETRRPCGAPLSLPHAYALLELHQSKAPLSVSELASRLSIDRTNVSRLCARMEEAGELTRSAHPGDQRAVLLSLSAHGKTVAASVDKSSATYFGDIANRLGDRLTGAVESLQLLSDTMTSTKEDK